MTSVRQVWSGQGVASSQPADGDTKLADRTLSMPPPAEPPAVPNAERLAPAAEGAAAWPHTVPTTSSAAVITKARKGRAQHLRRHTQRKVANWSFVLDLQLTWKTISALLRGLGAY
jgi:hypothetical protein